MTEDSWPGSVLISFSAVVQMRPSYRGRQLSKWIRGRLGNTAERKKKWNKTKRFGLSQWWPYRNKPPVVRSRFSRGNKYPDFCGLSISLLVFKYEHKHSKTMAGIKKMLYHHGIWPVMTRRWRLPPDLAPVQHSGSLLYSPSLGVQSENEQWVS